MSFDDDVLSAIEEAFGADSASLMEELDAEVAADAAQEEAANQPSLEELLAQLDQDIFTDPPEEVEAAPEPAPIRTRSLDDKHVLVSLGDSCFGFPMKNTLEIQQLPAVTYLPCLPEWVPGVCNIRGNIISIVDIKQLLGLEATPQGPQNRLVVVCTEKQDLTTGFIVDEVVGIAEMDSSRIRRPVGPLDSQLGAYLKGTYETKGAVICVLDLEGTLNSSTLRMC